MGAADVHEAVTMSASQSIRRIRRKTNSELRERAPAELVLFPFDHEAFPFSVGLDLELVSYRASCGNTQTVLPTGGPEAPDHRAVVYYGSVVQNGGSGSLILYYIGLDKRSYHGRICIATSIDGVHWSKPDLGLVSYPEE